MTTILPVSYADNSSRAKVSNPIGLLAVSSLTTVSRTRQLGSLPNDGNLMVSTVASCRHSCGGQGGFV